MKNLTEAKDHGDGVSSSLELDSRGILEKRSPEPLKDVSDQENVDGARVRQRHDTEDCEKRKDVSWCLRAGRRDECRHTVDGDDADEHEREDEEGPGRSEGRYIVGGVEPDPATTRGRQSWDASVLEKEWKIGSSHEHRDTDEDGEGEVDPEADVGELKREMPWERMEQSWRQVPSSLVHAGR